MFFVRFSFPHITFLFGFLFCQCCACVFAGAKKKLEQFHLQAVHCNTK